MRKGIALGLALLMIAAVVTACADGSKWDVPSQTSASGGNSADYSTNRLPRIEDFDWFWNRQTGEMKTNVPDGARMITDPSSLAGGWKVFVMRTPTTNPRAQYWNMDLRISGTAVDATQYWSGEIENGQFKDYSNANTNPFEGTILPGGLMMTLKDGFGCEILVNQWFSYNGAQYGLGIYYCVFPSDEAEPVGVIAFCRP